MRDYLCRTIVVAAVGLTSCGVLRADSSMVNVRDLGARGDGRSDDTAQFLQAIERAKARQAGVFVPRGRYMLSKTVSLEGIALTGPAVGAWPADVDTLPSIIPTHTDGPAFQLLAGGAISGIDITYQWPSEPEEGPAAVAISGIGTYIRNVRIRYAWDGIIADGEQNVGRANIENVFLVSIRNVGVRMTGTLDAPRLANVEVWNAGPVPRGLAQGIGFHLGHNDLIRLTDCFVFGMHHGFLLEERIAGCKVTGPTWGVMNGCTTDFCVVGLAVRGGHTLSVSGGTFWSHEESLLVEGAGGRIRLAGCELKSNGAPAVVVRGGDHTVLSGCTLLRTMEGLAIPAVVAEAGRLVIGAGYIASRGEPAVIIAEGVRSAAIHGNIIATDALPAVRVSGQVNEQVALAGNVIETPTAPPTTQP